MILNSTQQEQCRRILEHFGLYRQLNKTAEELCELAASLLRYASGERELKQDEIADVLIMLQQLLIGLSCEQQVRLGVINKLERTEQRIDRNYYRMDQGFKARRFNGGKD